MPELTNESKLLIQGYMLKLVAIPAVVLAIVSFLIGFFINRVATKEAELEMQKTVISANAALDTAKLEIDTEIDDRWFRLCDRGRILLMRKLWATSPNYCSC